MKNNNELNEKELNKIKLNIISAFDQMKSEIDNITIDLPISKSQSKFEQDKYYSTKIFGEIEKAIINFDNYSLTKPFLYLAYDNNNKSDKIEKSKLINFFENEISILKEVTVGNYSDITDYFSEFNKRLNELAKE